MTGCNDYRSGSGEMWPWCINCGRHLLTHEAVEHAPTGSAPGTRGDGPPAVVPGAATSAEPVAHDNAATAPGTEEHLPIGLLGAALLPRLHPETVAITHAALAALQEQAADVIDLRTEQAPAPVAAGRAHDQEGIS